MNTERFVLRDDVWNRIAPHLPGKITDCGVTAADNRLFMESVLWRVRTGSPWRDLPLLFGNWNSAFRHFRRWAQKGVFERLFEALSEEPNFEYALIDGTIPRVRPEGKRAAQKGDSKSGHRALKRRLDDQDRRLGRCLGISGPLRAAAWPAP